MPNEQVKTVLVFGATGLLGSDVVAELRARGYDVEAPTRHEVDITNDLDLSAYFLGSQASVAVNCAAYTQVDAAEEHSDDAHALNAGAAFNIARYAMWRRARLIHISTDFVFDGSSNTPYREDDETNPLGIYGKSKRQGELLIAEKNPDAIIVRTSWLFGTSGRCFPLTILNAAREGRSLRVVSDQVGSPTYTVDLARAIVCLIEENPPGGVYHVANSGSASWHELACETLRCANISQEVLPIRTEDWPTPAKRPKFSVLDTSKYQSLGLTALPYWKDAIARFVQRLEAKSGRE